MLAKEISVKKKCVVRLRGEERERLETRHYLRAREGECELGTLTAGASGHSAEQAAPGALIAVRSIQHELIAIPRPRKEGLPAGAGHAFIARRRLSPRISKPRSPPPDRVPLLHLPSCTTRVAAHSIRAARPR